MLWYNPLMVSKWERVDAFVSTKRCENVILLFTEVDSDLMYTEFLFNVWRTLTSFSFPGLPFLCKKCECLLLAVERFKVFGSDEC
jgi:hypothetical protein